MAGNPSIAYSASLFSGAAVYILSIRNTEAPTKPLLAKREREKEKCLFCGALNPCGWVLMVKLD